MLHLFFPREGGKDFFMRVAIGWWGWSGDLVTHDMGEVYSRENSLRLNIK
jgi:hypothetical protein